MRDKKRKKAQIDENFNIRKTKSVVISVEKY